MKKLTKKAINEILELTKGVDQKVLAKDLKIAASNLIEFIIVTQKCKVMTAKYMKKKVDKEYMRKTTNYDISFNVNILDIEEDFTHEIYSVSCNYVYVEKTQTIINAKNILKKIQNILYVLYFQKYKKEIEEIDKAVETSRSVNHNDILFTKDFYTKIGLYKNTNDYKKGTKVQISEIGAKRLAELKEKRAA